MRAARLYTAAARVALAAALLLAAVEGLAWVALRVLPERFLGERVAKALEVGR